MIPDRTAQSLKTAYRKFSKLNKEEFVKMALLPSDGVKGFRYSHIEENPPIFGPGYKEEENPQLATTASKKPAEES